MPGCHASLGSWAASIVFASLCLFVLPAPALACSCGMGVYPCGGFDHLRAIDAPVFTGTVVGITDVQREVGPAGQKQTMTVERRVRFIVTESFFAAVPKNAEVTTSGSTASCGYDFELGRVYLVYADATSERLTVSLCSRTKPLADASDDVELLRGWVRGSAEARIFGAVALQKPEGGSAGPQSGLLIVAEAPGHVYQTVTDSRGQFRFRGLPMGRYSVRAWLNEQMTKESHFDPVLSDRQYCAEVNIHFIPGARVSGRVTDPRRRPLENVSVVMKDTRPFEQRPIQGPDRFFGTSDKTGRYEIQGILPGPYLVSVAPASLRYGGNVVPADIRVEPPGLPSGGVLSVSADQNVEGVDLELPAFELATLMVSVARPDGRPAGGGGIEVRDADGRMMLRSFGLNGTGDVTLQGLVGQAYRIEAYYNERESHQRLRSESLQIVVERENPQVRLRLKSSSQ